ncbi:MAG: BrnT family toxin [Betaproteobacteria bacterium]
MRISYDPAKNQRNIRDRGLSFESAAEFDFENALYAVDKRRDYGETRYIAVGMLEGRLHVLCFTETPEGIRVISFRKANAREVNRHAKAKAAD